MRRIEKEEILIPLLNKRYQDDELFYKSFSEIIKKGGELSLSESFGISIIISNFIDENCVAEQINSFKENQNFRQIIEGLDNIDENLFEEETAYSFVRYVFKCEENFIVGFRDEENKEIEFALFISIARTNLCRHIISFIFTTWKDSESVQEIQDSYIKLSNRQIINLVKKGSREFEELNKAVLAFEPNVGKLLEIDKNTSLALELWRKEWSGEEDNLLDAAKYIVDNPHFFYSLLSLDEKIFRRNFENIMDSLGWCFSSSRVQRGLISRNIHIAVSLKPNEERFNANGHDGTEFRLWEIIGLQNYLSNSIDACYSKYILDPKGETAEVTIKEMRDLVNNLNKIYNSNALFKKFGKGDLWIKLSIYLQDQMEISSVYDLYTNRLRIVEEDESCRI